MIDNHQLTVIAMDLVPIKPYSTNFINIGMGERLCKLTRSKSNNIVIFLCHLSIKTYFESELCNLVSCKSALILRTVIDQPYSSSTCWFRG
jgi:hypothetical protein